MDSDKFALGVKAIVTLAFLGFAYLMRSAEGANGMANMIVGAALTYWFGTAAADSAMRLASRRRANDTEQPPR